MIKKIKYLFLSLSLPTLLLISSSGVSAQSKLKLNDFDHFACSTGACSAACQGISQLSATSCGSGSNKAVGNLASLVVGILAKVVGVIAVIMIIFSGFRYVMAGGDSNSINSAKNTLVYALIGLAIAVLAQLLASEVLTTASSTIK
jgi:hypothetical protein